MSSMFPPEHPASEGWQVNFLEAWRALSPSVRERLRAGDEHLSPEEVSQLFATPHPPAVITKWMNESGPDAWNVSPLFVDWARSEAPGEQEL